MLIKEDQPTLPLYQQFSLEYHPKDTPKINQMLKKKYKESMELLGMYVQ
jgi:hypothetical protein